MEREIINITNIDRGIANGRGTPIGPWVEGRDPKVTSSPFNDQREIYNSIREIWDKSKYVCSILKSALEDIHGIEKSDRYWDIILAGDIYKIISIMYVRMEILKRCIEKEKGKVGFIVLEDEGYRPPVSFGDYVSMCTDNDFFNWQIFSQCAKKMNLNMKSVEQSVDGMKSIVRVDSEYKKLSKRITDYRNEGIYSDISHSNLRIQSSLQKIIFMAKTYGRSWEISNFPVSVDRGNMIYDNCNIKTRRKLSNLDIDTGGTLFDELLADNILHNIPSVWLEEFGQLRNEVEGVIEEAGYPSVIVSGPLSKNAAFRLWTAECVERGAKLFGVQHGGGYGDIPENIFELTERHLSDKFLTWGWKRREKDHPLPTQRLYGAKVQEKEKNVQGLLWITDGYMTYGNHKYPLRLRDNLNGRNCFQCGKNSSIKFYNHIGERIKSSTTIRTKGGSEDVNRNVKSLFPRLNVESRGNITSQASSFVVSIVDHFPSTSFLELMYYNFPVIVFDDKPEWYIDEAASDVLRDLVECKILHTNPESAAKTVNKIHPDFGEWWHEPGRQKVISRAVHDLARKSDSPMSEYARFVNRHT